MTENFSFNQIWRLFCLAASFTAVLAATPPHPQSAFRGAEALEMTRRTVAFGERPSGSAAIEKLRAWIQTELKPLGCQVSIDKFIGQTPNGPVPMANIVAKFPGTSGRALAVTGHYDTKHIAMVHFVGANDGGSSTGFLLELARVVAHMKHRDDIYLVWFDGEEAVAEWTDTDSRYGSRYLAARWAADGTLRRLQALINVDMIGDKDLDILKDTASSAGLRDLVWRIAGQLGDGRYFHQDNGGVEDDHLPFLAAGANAIDLIDLDYGPDNSYWHTAADTMDKLGANSFQVTGDVVVEALKQLDK